MPAPVSAPLPPKKEGRSLPVVFVLATLLVIAVVIAGYFYYQYRQSQKDVNAEEIKTLEETLGKMMLLPENETPTLATVTDKEKLAGQAFFQKAENGDKVLIYTESGRAILYRPSVNKIVDVTTISMQTKEETQAKTDAQVAPLTAPAPTENPVPVEPAPAPVPTATP